MDQNREFSSFLAQLLGCEGTSFCSTVFSFREKVGVTFFVCVKVCVAKTSPAGRFDGSRPL